ncbi:MAG TPA: PIN domain-containing protein [Candidatus Methanoperedenaceae archaeon]|nr:PIN domain-containing protein [Candidatus Methanoperedenaceae archaeon]
MKDKIALIDSNMLSYVFDSGEPEKRRVCSELVADCWRGNRKFAVSIQNLSEFYVIVTRKITNPIPEKTAKRFIELIIDFEGWSVLSSASRTVVSAIDISSEYRINYWDALLAATMRENSVFSIYTEDGDFRKIPWIKVENPFKKRNSG